jgi:hypothetical protein
VFHEQPPKGLAGNQAILEWARIRSGERTKVLLVIAWLATAVALLLFLVAVNDKANAANAKQISIQLHRLGTSGDCPALPVSTRLVVSVGNKHQQYDLRITENCRALFTVSPSEIGGAVLTLVGSGSYHLADPNATYELGSSTWEVYVTTSEQARLRLSIFKYSSVECPDAQTAFETFEKILQAKALSLRGMFDTSDRRYDYLSGVSVIAAGRSLDMSARDVRDYWQQTASLQILSGLCFRKQNVELMRSQIFLGTLGAKLPEPLVADLPLSPDEFGATRDIHTASILYALAQDAEQRRVDRDVTISYLARAREVASQIQADAATLLVSAIDAALNEVGAPKQMKL